MTAVDPARGSATRLGRPTPAHGSARADGSDVILGLARSGGPSDIVGREAWSAPATRHADPEGLVRVMDADGWTPASDGVTWRHDLVAAAVRVSAPVDDDGAALFARMTAPDPTDVGRPAVEHLPADLDDAVLVARRQLVDGALTMRVDLVRHAQDLDVVVSARLPEPARADAVVMALVQLLAAVGAGEDRGKLGG